MSIEAIRSAASGLGGQGTGAEAASGFVGALRQAAAMEVRNVAPSAPGPADRLGARVDRASADLTALGLPEPVRAKSAVTVARPGVPGPASTGFDQKAPDEAFREAREFMARSNESFLTINLASSVAQKVPKAAGELLRLQ